MMMDERKFRILQAIIDDYILTAMPVGSRTISKKYEKGLSSATIRNEMSDLEELGYLDQPHVSAGRVPSAKAYRLYVDQLLDAGLIDNIDPVSIQRHFAGRLRKMEEVVSHAAMVLSSLTHYTAVVSAPSSPEPRIRRLQLVSVSDQAAMVLIITDSGIIRDAMITVDEGLDNDALYAISKMLTERLYGKTFKQALACVKELLPMMRTRRKLLSGIEALTRQSGQHAAPSYAIGGTGNILSYPEYSDIEKARGFLSLIETREKIAQLMEHNGSMAFTIRIGPETGMPELNDLTVVTASYMTSGESHGTVGVIGPIRMQYQKVLSILSIMGRQLSELLGQDEQTSKRG
jgi:heat-inducible transcriptional repressor